jgi:hypothetical protein
MIRYIDYLRHHLAMGDRITPQLVRHDLPGFTAMTAQELFEEAFGCCAVTTCL